MTPLLGFGGENLSPVIETTLWANTVRQHGVSAVATGDHGRRGQFHIKRLPTASPCLWSVWSGYCHL